MGETRPGATREIAPARAVPHWAVAAWRGARAATSRFVVALGKADEEARARDREEQVFQPKER